MRVLCFVALPLLFSACAVAQSAPAKGPVMQLPPIQTQPAPHMDLQLAPATPQVGLEGRNLSAIDMAQATLARVMAQVKAEPEGKVCYAIRSYAFARDGADSDATRLTGSSTCRPSSQLKLKSAVQVQVKVVR